MNEFIKKYLIFCALLFACCFLLVPHEGHTSDMYCWTLWTNFIFTNGLSNVYSCGTDYLPLYHYILKLFGSFQGSIENINSNIHYLKLITLPFDFITGFFIALLIKRRNEAWDSVLLNIILFYLLNVSILYNTIIWGQVDAILTCFAFLSCYFAYKKRALASLVFIILAINFKLQAIIFLPIIGLMILPQIRSTASLKNSAKWILIPLTLQLLIILPFIIRQTTEDVWLTVTHSFGKYPKVSMNAYNIWELFFPGKKLIEITDNNMFLNISLKHWGLLMFFISSGIALYPIAKQTYLSIVKKIEFTVPLEKFLITCTLVPILFFYFNTQMHERYCHPAFAFLITYAVYMKKPLIAGVGCIAYFLNMEDVLRFLHLHNYGTLIFHRSFISALFLLTIILLYFDLFDLKLKKKTKEQLFTA